MSGEYCTADQVRQRMTSAGYQFFADNDQSGTVSAAEVADTITTAIVYAGNLLDEIVELSGCRAVVARGSGNAWLMDRAIDIAVYRATTTGGGGEVPCFRVGYDEALKAMDRIRGGGKIPGLRYQYPFPNVNRSSRFPSPINLKR